MATEQIVPLAESGVTVKELEDAVRQLQRIVQQQDELVDYLYAQVTELLNELG